MLSSEELVLLLQSLIWLLAGVGVFITGMNFMGDSLERSAGNGMKKWLEKISSNRFSGVGIGAGVTAIIQSSSATSVMVIGLVNAGVLTLTQSVPIIMGANIGTTVTGVIVAFKNDYFNMAMYLLAFVGVMMGFSKKEKIKIAGCLFSGLGLIFVGLSVMSSEQAFGNPLVERTFTHMFTAIDFPLLLILVGIVFTALIQSSSAATGVVITMVGTGILPLDMALFIVLGSNIGTCVTALLAAIGTSANSRRVAFVHFAFNLIGTVLFAGIIWIFKDSMVNLLVSLFPGEGQMSLQMRVSAFHVIFNVATTCMLLPFTKHLVKLSCICIRDKDKTAYSMSLKYVDDRMLSIPQVALIQVKEEIRYMFDLVESNVRRSLEAVNSPQSDLSQKIGSTEELIDYTNRELTSFLIRLAAAVDESEEKVIAGYFHVLNDLERIGDHAENFCEMGIEMSERDIKFSLRAKNDVSAMAEQIMKMFSVSKAAFKDLDRSELSELTELEKCVDEMKRNSIDTHFSRLTEGSCNALASPYYSSLVLGLERVADHLVNVGFSILNPIGSQKGND